MRLHAWAWLALSSLWLAPLAGATRPRYGGSLTVELSSAWSTLQPFVGSSDVIAPLMAENLVRLNEKGQIEPQLAVAWQHDADRKRWRFALRPKVLFHDGEPLSAASAAPSLVGALKKKYGSANLVQVNQNIMPAA